MNNKLVRMWEEVVMAQFMVLSSISMAGLKKSTRNISQDSWSLAPKFEPDVHPIQNRSSHNAIVMFSAVY
jgi:hypothetical protein